MRRLARAGIPILSYSFMWGETFRDYFMNFLESRPLFDWVRTDLSVPWRDGSTALALDMVAQWITIQKSVLIVQVSISFFSLDFQWFFIKTKIEGGKVEKGIPSLLKSHYSLSHRNGSAATNLSKVAFYWKRTNVFAKRQFSLLAKSSESAGWLCTQLRLEKRGEQRFLTFSQSRCYYSGCISHC